MDDTHSFIVRVWLEPRESPGGEPIVRSWVENARSGERKALRSLDDLAPWIMAQLGGSSRSAGPG